MAKRATSKRVSRQWVIDQAEVMLTAFEDVGVSKFDLTLATEARQAAEFVPGITIAKLRRALPSLFDRNERECLNFIIRPRFGRDNRLVQLDDLKAAVRALAFDRRDADEARRVLREGVESVIARLKVVGA